MNTIAHTLLQIELLKAKCSDLYKNPPSFKQAFLLYGNKTLADDYVQEVKKETNKVIRTLDLTVIKQDIFGEQERQINEFIAKYEQTDHILYFSSLETKELHGDYAYLIKNLLLDKTHNIILHARTRLSDYLHHGIARRNIIYMSEQNNH